MFKKMILAIAVVVVPANLALAAPNTAPALEPTHQVQQIDPAELSLPGILIDEIMDKVEQKVEADGRVYLQNRMAAQERELMKILSGEIKIDVRVSTVTTLPDSSGS
jgi:hypothetical protein